MRDYDDREHTTDVTGVIPVVVEEESTARVSALAVRLICVAGADLGRSFRITRKEMAIGRGRVDVMLQGKDVSRCHARLSHNNGDWVIEDLGSQNGTFVNGTAVETPAPLRIGDRIQIGSTILVFAHHDELEERMHQLQRLEAMGALAGGLAHDFNNALAVILGTLELFERRLPPHGELREMATDMKNAASSAASLAQRLLSLGRTQPLGFDKLEVAPLVTRTLAMIKRQLPKIEVRIDIEPALCIHASPEEMNQVLLNLFINARDAMRDGGVLRVHAREEAFDSAQAAAHHLPAKGEYVELIVADSGVGMDEHTMQRAFEPFFTTKPPGQGTGLGLAMIHSIVRRHGGSIVAESVVGQGTTFRIWLPRAV